MRVAFDHSMQFFESRLSSIDTKLDLPTVPKLQADGDGKVAVLKTMFEKTSKKIEKSVAEVQSQTQNEQGHAQCQTELDVAEAFAQILEQVSAHCQTIMAQSALASIQTVAMTAEALSQTDAHLSPLTFTTGVASTNVESSGHALNIDDYEAICLLQQEKVREKVSNCLQVRSGENKLPGFVVVFFEELVLSEQCLWRLDPEDITLPSIRQHKAATVIDDFLDATGIGKRVPRLRCLTEIASLLTDYQKYVFVQGFFSHIPSELTHFLVAGGVKQYLESIGIELNEPHVRSSQWDWSKDQWKSWSWNGR